MGMTNKHPLQMEIVEDALVALGADLRVNAAEEGKVESALAEAIVLSVYRGSVSRKAHWS